MKRLMAALLISIICMGAAPKNITGRVTGVHDGDTLTVLTAGNIEQKIRLYGIDAPEEGQPFGDKSKQALSSYTFGKDVTVTVLSSDRYGRQIGVVYVDGKNINQGMVAYGYAWWYRKYAKNSPALGQLETAAKTAKSGLWAHPNAVAPWAWRGHPDTPATTQPTDKPAQPTQPVYQPVQSSRAEDYTVYVTKSGNRYHRATCQAFRGASTKPLLKSAAIARRLTACSNCNP